MSELIKEECGVFGAYGINESSNYVYLGLNFLQHRGQESCGIVSTDGISLYKQVGLGKVSEFFSEEKIQYLEGHHSIGHVRYSTTGSPTLSNAQPFTASTQKGPLAIAHNGNLTNASEIRASLIEQGKAFHSSSDSEVLMHLIAEAPFDNLAESVQWTLRQLEGAYSILILSKDTVIAARDPLGFHPLALGRIGDDMIEDGGPYVFSSENSAFSIIEGHFIRDIEPNEMVVVNKGSLKSMKIKEEPQELRQCVFELIYFSKPSSKIFGKSVYRYRYEVGKQLAKEQGIEADVVIPVPDSGIVSALGYSEESGIPMSLGLIRSHYIGRTFIEPSQRIRDFGVKLKFIPVHEMIEGKRIILLDDSLVRGTTSRKIVKMLKRCHPKSIHLRIASPPVRFPCFYGIDFSTKEELIANKMDSLDKVAEFIGVDTIGYVSIEGLFSLTGLQRNHFCTACFSGEYATELKPFAKGGFENDIKQFEFPKIR